MSRAPLPFEIDARSFAGHGPLGMPAEQFLRNYWQKRPLLIRNAFPDLESPLQPEDLAGLACEEVALSRLIRHDRARDGWQVETGPFDEDLFPGLGDRDWTLLVQDVDKWDADVAALLPHFAFLPRWRIDDIMVSFAATGGSVGAHVDQYDVFLLQGQGHRRWQIDASDAMGRGVPPQEFRDDVELRLLREFTPTHEWVLGPGDMLYLPPMVPHHGVAEDPCLTFSVGMRAPSVSELMGDYIDTLAADADESIRYHDETLQPPADPNEIDADAMTRVVEALNVMRMRDPDRLGDWFGSFITGYRNAQQVVAGGAAPPRIELEWLLSQGQAVLHRNPFSRMAWRRAGDGARLFVSGTAWPLALRDARTLAAEAQIDGRAYVALSGAGRETVLELLAEGHYTLLDADSE
ncbi:cupin domain-containing protein [Luteimonas fraxinea]|uniref:Cupin domain-containing protein n=1 Tax=Luteimonas fraxinea TaxID=2901869 RepID=A0ABS8UC22_9GAMM|nr:cupin domain-containing protein [Luteimonas fraxinea]MCD9096274.1 cupin domain-containing protein [Luteimonas fraxinea]MCD9125617.1 cupin domain-containing protein [Luteimonas fraxinea]UHH10348.1 cupin domain-containing protein [Luteimonas fraxinea]